jgi:hypothetical protein
VLPDERILLFITNIPRKEVTTLKKLFTLLLSLLIVTAFVLIGCEKKPEPPKPAPAPAVTPPPAPPAPAPAPAPMKPAPAPAKPAKK